MTTEHQIYWIRQQQRTAVKQIQDVVNLHRDNIVIVDTETTGLDYNKDEIIQVAAMDYSGEVLLNRYIMPTCKIKDGAFAKHELTVELLKKKKATSFKKVYPELVDLVTGKVVIGYNVNFDSYFLTRMCHMNGLPFLKPDRWQDMMGLFSQIAGVWDSGNGRFTWQKLTRFSKNRVVVGAHNAVVDCKLVLAQLHKIDRNIKKG